MRTFLVWATVLLASVAVAGSKKKPTGKSSKPAVVVDAPPVMAKLLKTALGSKFAVSINGDALSDAPTTKEVRAVTSPVAAIAVVLGRSQGESWTVTVLNGADGTPLEQQLFRSASRKPLKALPKEVTAALLAACATGNAPPVEGAPAPTPTPVATPTPAQTPTAVTTTEPAKPAATTEPTPAKPVEPATTKPAEVTASVSAPLEPSAWPAVRVGVGFRGSTRSLSWAGDPDKTLSQYGRVFIPQVAIDATWYPGAPFTKGILGNLGLHFSGDIIVGLSSKLLDVAGTKYGTRGERYRFEAAFRQPFGNVFSIEAVAGYSTQSFSIDEQANDGTRRPTIPSVAFTGPRAAAGVRLMRLGPIGIDAMAGFTFLTGFGQLKSADYFPRVQGVAVDAGGGVSLEVATNLHLRASFEWSRYFLTLRPEDGARFPATAAADQYLGGSASLLFVM